MRKQCSWHLTVHACLAQFQSRAFRRTQMQWNKRQSTGPEGWLAGAASPAQQSLTMQPPSPPPAGHGRQGRPCSGSVRASPIPAAGTGRGSDVFVARPDFPTDSLAVLRAKQKSFLATEAKRMAADLRRKATANQTTQPSGALTLYAELETPGPGALGQRSVQLKGATEAVSGAWPLAPRRPAADLRRPHRLPCKCNPARDRCKVVCWLRQQASGWLCTFSWEQSSSNRDSAEDTPSAQAGVAAQRCF